MMKKPLTSLAALKILQEDSADETYISYIRAGSSDVNAAGSIGLTITEVNEIFRSAKIASEKPISKQGVNDKRLIEWVKKVRKARADFHNSVIQTAAGEYDAKALFQISARQNMNNEPIFWHDLG